MLERVDRMLLAVHDRARASDTFIRLLPALPRRELASSALAARGNAIANEKDTLHVHPKNLHGMLLGISRPGFAWTWSGQPARVPPHAATTPD